MRPDAVASLDMRYRAATPRSREVYERALKVLPGGHTREVAHHPPYPAAISHGASEIFD